MLKLNSFENSLCYVPSTQYVAAGRGVFEYLLSSVAVSLCIYIEFFAVQVRKVLWTRKAPACLLILLYAYGMPRLPPVHKYSSLRSTAHRPAAGRCSGRWATRTALTV